ncbi:MAG: Fic family protein [Acidimicrobiales bacterium]
MDATQQQRLLALLNRGERIKARYDGICETFGPIAKRLTRQQRAYQTHHSVRLELQGPETIEETERIVSELPVDLLALSSVLAKHAIERDTHLVEVAGAYGAELLAEAIAGDFRSDRPFRESDLRQLNQIVVGQEWFAGSYRQNDFIGIGENFDRSDPLWFSRAAEHAIEVSWVDVPIEMQRLCEYVSRMSACPPLSAAVAHAWFTRVHPFRDGNGRVARLIANLVLLRNSWPPVVIRYTDREDYLDSLEDSDQAGDIRQFFELMVNWIDLNLDEYTQPEVFGRSYQAELAGQPTARLDCWSRGARALINGLRAHLTGLDIFIERVNMPAQSTFVLLERHERRAATLLAKIHPRSGRDIRVGVGFMSRAMQDGTYIAGLPTGLDGDHDAPTIYFQERADSDSPYPYVGRDESEVSPAEISFPFADPTTCLVRVSKTSVERMTVDVLAERLAKSIEAVCHGDALAL